MDKNNKDKVVIKKCCLVCRFFTMPICYSDGYDPMTCRVHIIKANELKNERNPSDNVPYISDIDDAFKVNCDGWFELNEKLK